MNTENLINEIIKDDLIEMRISKRTIKETKKFRIRIRNSLEELIDVI